MRTLVLAAVSTLTVSTSLLAVAPSDAASLSSNRSVLVAQRSTNLDSAEEVCTDQAESRGLTVHQVLSVTPFSGGAEVGMQVGQRRGSYYTVGCDYSSATGEVQLYRLEGEDNNRTEQYDDDDNSNWRNSYSDSGRIRNEDDAESIARQVVGDQLNIDNPFSSVVRIGDVNRANGNQNWEVKGRVNGAPFVVRLRASDAYVLGFDLQ